VLAVAQPRHHRRQARRLGRRGGVARRQGQQAAVQVAQRHEAPGGERRPRRPDVQVAQPHVVKPGEGDCANLERRECQVVQQHAAATRGAVHRKVRRQAQGPVVDCDVGRPERRGVEEPGAHGERRHVQRH